MNQRKIYRKRIRSEISPGIKACPNCHMREESVLLNCGHFICDSCRVKVCPICNEIIMTRHWFDKGETFNADVAFVKNVQSNTELTPKSLQHLKENGLMLKFIPSTFNDYEELCKVAISVCPQAIQYVDLSKIHNLIQLAQLTVSNDGTLIRFFKDTSVYEDIELWITAIKNNSIAIADCPFPKGYEYQQCALMTIPHIGLHLVDQSKLINPDEFNIQLID